MASTNEENGVEGLFEASAIMTDQRAFETLVEYLQRIPAVSGSIGMGHVDDDGWWVKFSIDISHKLAWHVVQELAHVLNSLSLNERLPTVFMPVSPPPYMNGGPAEYLTWVIECHDRELKPGTVMKWLEGQLPRPVEIEAEWMSNDDG